MHVREFNEIDTFVMGMIKIVIIGFPCNINFADWNNQADLIYVNWKQFIVSMKRF